MYIFIKKEKHKKKLINIGSNFEYSITDYAKIIMDVLKYKCKIVYDKSKPDGVKRKKLDNSLLKKLDGIKKLI